MRVVSHARIIACCSGDLDEACRGIQVFDWSVWFVGALPCVETDPDYLSHRLSSLPPTHWCLQPTYAAVQVYIESSQLSSRCMNIMNTTLHSVCLKYVATSDKPGKN